MKRLFLIAIFVCAATLPALGASPTLQQGMKLYKQHRYNEAVRLLYRGLSKVDAKEQAALQLSFGMACLANARCYDQFYQTALAVQHDYLKHLVQTKGPKKTASRLVALHLGKTRLENGDLKSAVTWLKRFLALPETSGSAQVDARIALGTVYYLLGDSKAAQDSWSKVSLKAAEARALMAATYQRLGLVKQQPLQMADDALAQLTANGKPLSIQSAIALLAVYTHTQQTSKGFKIIEQADLAAYAYEEVLSPYKTIHFYDPALLGRLAAFYNYAAVEAMEKARGDSHSGTRSAATYYLGEAYSQMGRTKKAVDAFSQFLAGKPKSRSIEQQAQVRQAFLHLKLRPSKDPAASLKTFKIADAGPALVSDVLLACSEQQINCPAAVKRAITLWQQSRGRAPVDISIALGRHFQWQGQYAKALTHLEGGRDKSRKNRIEANPPVMLIDLARVYYHEKQFSEALEIYFEMSKQFPAVRQIQIALQGVYAIEERSAGDAKIF